ncbi:5-carboxymethyl-2-hydroxymuconate Delta-isomerase [Shewanella nanhaiensis]|uniref:5-carboxymethyl-2-hydroxymuconate Delta-isomerase n=1 Tax=Shewanella nanhaiensis TaxID=2864872 RepID=A0ABS7E0Y8_9GAMM|nr:5-carboxymethyl-2-hydroxymuconate Delta-isomerase [Shewanella nanhaiensis]
MPHCVIEHSENIEGDLLIACVYQGALASNLFEAEGSDIKVRALPYANYQTGNVELKFVHVTLKILSGRNLEQKSRLTELVLAQLKKLQMTDCSISVEVADIERDSYAKVIV